LTRRAISCSTARARADTSYRCARTLSVGDAVAAAAQQQRLPPGCRCAVAAQPRLRSRMRPRRSTSLRQTPGLKLSRDTSFIKVLSSARLPFGMLKTAVAHSQRQPTQLASTPGVSAATSHAFSHKRLGISHGDHAHETRVRTLGRQQCAAQPLDVAAAAATPCKGLPEAMDKGAYQHLELGDWLGGSHTLRPISAQDAEPTFLVRRGALRSRISIATMSVTNTPRRNGIPALRMSVR